MAIEAGDRLAQYEVLSTLGEGGMGKVFLARDRELGRKVAIKVLGEAFSEDQERLARFRREARLLASLNHPTIATLFGLQEEEGQSFLVMELVEGETLGARLKRGALAPERAAAIFLQIAQGLEVAHGKGVVHRDLKPSNVMLDGDGRVKILDFGLAKALAGSLSPDDQRTQSWRTQMDFADGRMVAVGTPGFMSPEQALGRDVDRRTDIWSFGCCLFEALTGQPAFDAPNTRETIAKIFGEEPPWNLLPPLEESLARLLRRCLEKEPRQRLSDIGEARYTLSEITGSSDLASGILSRHSELTSALGRAGITEVRRVEIEVEKQMSEFNSRSFAVFPDGATLVFSARSTDGHTQLYLRRLDSFQSAPIPNTQGALSPFVSPDGRWIAYLRGDSLERIATAGGVPTTISKITNLNAFHEATWDRKGNLFFGQGGDICRVPASGGGAETILQETDEAAFLFPSMLPGSGAMLAAVAKQNWDESMLSLVIPETGEIRPLASGGYHAQYVPTGHIVFARDGTLHALPFSIKELRTTGAEVALLDSLAVSPGGRAAQFQISEDGTLFYELAQKSELVWVDRSGKTKPFPLPPDYYRLLRFSPDGKHLAIQLIRGTEYTIRLFNIDRSVTTTVRGKGRQNSFPVWARDGKSFFFSSSREGPIFRLFRQGVASTQDAERLHEERFQIPNTVSPDGKTLLFSKGVGFEWQIWGMPVDGSREPEPVIDVGASVGQADYHPSEPVIAYVSQLSGRREVHIRHLERGVDVQVSADGGFEPVWSHDGHELFYRSGREMLSVPIHSLTDLEVGEPTVLFEGDFIRARFGRGYDVDPTGTRFLMIQSDKKKTSSIRIVFNWYRELTQMVSSS